MDAVRHAHIKSLFLKALELGEKEREELLADACASDPELRREVDNLLACASAAQTPLQTANDGPDNAATEASDESVVGQRRCPKCQRTFPSGVYFCLSDGEVLVTNPQALVGMLFDEIYEIEAMLGEGGMGTVYRARHRLLRDVVALKMLRDDERENVRWRRRFVREGQAARRFRHPNAVTVYDLRTARDGTIYLVLEFVQGMTLRAAFRDRRRFDCIEALHLLEPLAAVLDTAHQAGVVHRDLKPENLMLTNDGSVVKLLDLGIAGILGSDGSIGETAKLTQAGMVVGTPRYMSPEQWGERSRDGSSGVDARADIYSLGVVVFELVTGRAPYRGNDADELRRFHVFEPPPDPRAFNSEIPEGFAQAILVALSKDRADRFPTAGAFVRALARGVGYASGARPDDSSIRNSNTIAVPTVIDVGQSPTEVGATITDVGQGATAEDPPSNLPQSLNSFIGRHSDVDDVVSALQRHRLVSLVGPGGIGKTRLALQAAREAFDAFPDGVWLVDLSVLVEPSLVLQSIGRVLEVADHTSSHPEDAIVEAVGARRLLLVLDNCEHVITAVRELVDDLLRRCPHVRVLATSREVLGIAAEYSRDVPALATPPVGLAEAELLKLAQTSDAVLLFIDRARAVRGDFRLTAQNVVAVVALCRRLDGIPLALELAAARTVVMTPSQILARIEKNLDLLASRSPGIPDRHRTMRASIEWSFQLLPAHLQDAFSLLSVFRGGWTLDAAECIVGEYASTNELGVVDAIEQLAASSLIVTDEVAGEIRFHMLETIREFGRGLVADENASSIAAAHARYFLSFVERADEKLAGPDQQEWLARVAADIDNIRAASEFGRAESDSELVLALAGCMGRFWTVRGFVAEGLSTLRDALERAPNAPGSHRAKALNWAGNLAVMAGDFETSRAWHEASLQLRREAGDQEGIAASLHNLGGLAADQGDFVRADHLYEECTSIATSIGDNLRLGMALINRGRAANERGLYEQAFELLERGIDFLEQSGHVYGVCVGLLCLGDAQMCAGDLDRGWSSFDRSLSLAIEIGERTASGFAQCGLGSIARYRGDIAEAKAYAERTVSIARELGAEDLHATGLALCGDVALLEGNLDAAHQSFRRSLRIRSARNLRSGIAGCLEGLAYVAVAESRFERAARFLGAASALRNLIDVPIPMIDRSSVGSAVGRVRSELGDPAFDEAHSTGAELPLTDLRADIIE